jgi:hypothetical protein
VLLSSLDVCLFCELVSNRSGEWSKDRRPCRSEVNVKWGRDLLERSARGARGARRREGSVWWLVNEAAEKLKRSIAGLPQHLYRRPLSTTPRGLAGRGATSGPYSSPPSRALHLHARSRTGSDVPLGAISPAAQALPNRSALAPHSDPLRRHTARDLGLDSVSRGATGTPSLTGHTCDIHVGRRGSGCLLT